MNTHLATLIRKQAAPVWRAFEQDARDPRDAQTRLLMNILRRNRDTAYGRQHGFAHLRNARDFSAALPMITFTDIASFVNRMKHGVSGILTADPVIRFNLTSGTTDRPKSIPVTRRGWRAAARVSLLWLHRTLRDHPGFLDHALLLALGPAVESHTPAGIPCGSASGMTGAGLPPALRPSLVLPPTISALKDYDLRYTLMARLALAERLSFIATPNPTTLLRINEFATQHQEGIIRAIHDGVLFHACPFDCPPPVRRLLNELGRAVTPDRDRARLLEAVARRHGSLFARACRPDLRLIGCWLGGTIGLQTPKLVSLFGAAMPLRDIGYLASEAAMTLPFEDGSPAGILALRTNYYEFIPEDGADASPQDTLLPCHEIRQGKRYRIVLTNWNGLYRYDIGDVIEVQGFHHRTPVIAFVRKSGDMLDLTGEKLHVNHLLMAFQSLKNRMHVTVGPFRVVPDPLHVRYELLLRLAPEPTAQILRAEILPFLDACLCAVNTEYRDKRHSGRLKPPRLHVMDAAWEEDVRRASPATNRPDFQYKWRPIAPTLSRLDVRHIKWTVQQ